MPDIDEKIPAISLTMLHSGREGRDETLVVTTRRRLHIEMELPLGMAYSDFLHERLADADPPRASSEVDEA